MLPEGGIDEHTLACWHFDEDLVDEKNNLTLVGRGFEITAEASKFGNCSAKMNSSGDYATVVSAVFADLFTKDFTIDFWLRREEFSVGNTLFGFSDKENAYDVRSFPFNFALGSAGSSTSSDIFRINDTKIGSVGFSDVKVFGHIAIVFSRENRTCSLYLNGSKLGEYIFSTLPTDTRNLSFYFPGSGTTMRIDEFRISDCIRWNEDFTPPTEPYTLATGPSKKAINAVIPEVELPNTVYTQDNLVAGENIQIKEVVNPNVIDDNTLLCWHFDGDTKDVVNGEDFTLYPGYGSINNTYYKFGSGSAPDYVQNGLYITLKEPLTDKDSFTLDYWIYGHGADTDTLSFTTRLAGGIGTTNGTSIYLRAFGNDQNLLDVSDANGNYVGSLAKSNSISSKEWSHWAYTYNKDTREFSVYANGVKQGAYAFPSGNPFNIEIIYPVDTNYNQFAIDEFRVTKSLAWDKDFTPPTEAYTKGEGGVKKAISAIIPPVKLPSDLYRQSNLLGGKDIEIVKKSGGIDEDTIACWHFDTSVNDEVNGLPAGPFAGENNLLSDYVKFGEKSFNGGFTNTSLSFNSNESFSFDFWAHIGVPGSSSYASTGYCGLAGNTDIFYVCGIAGSKMDVFLHGTTTATDFVTPRADWFHVYGGYDHETKTYSVFANGKRIFSQVNDKSFNTSFFSISYQGSGVRRYDEVRVSKCVRWTEDFTPPTAPYEAGSAGSVINFTGEAGGAGASFPLFYHTFADHILNDASWLRGDTFSWQSGDMYVSAYNHLVEDWESGTEQKSAKIYRWEIGNGQGGYNPFTISSTPSVGSPVFWSDIYSVKGVLGIVVSFDSETNSFMYDDYQTGTTKTAISPTVVERLISFETETIGSTEITFYRAKDGHKIVLADQEDKVSAIYRATGVAWYYILDTTNTRFKLPRTQYAFVGLRDAVGKYVAPDVSIQHYHAIGYNNNDNAGSFIATNNTGKSVTLPTVNDVTGYRGWNGSGGGGFTSSSETYSANMLTSLEEETGTKTIQPTATQMYLYFYVGNTVRNQTEVDVGAVTEQLNGKADLDFNNVTKVGKETAVAWGRNFVNTNRIVASGTAGIAGTYNLGFTDGKVRLGVFTCAISTNKNGFSNMAIKTDIVTEFCGVVGTNNGFAALSTTTLPFVNSVSISFPSTDAGISPSSVRLVGYFE